MSTETVTYRVPFLIKDGAPVVIEGDFPITEASWGQIMAVLTAMKPMLTHENPTHEESGE